MRVSLIIRQLKNGSEIYKNYFFHWPHHIFINHSLQLQLCLFIEWRGGEASNE